MDGVGVLVGVSSLVTVVGVFAGGAKIIFRVGEQNHKLDQCSDEIKNISTKHDSFVESVNQNFMTVKQSQAKMSACVDAVEERVCRLEKFANGTRKQNVSDGG